MTLCVIDGKQCQCQPDEGKFCEKACTRLAALEKALRDVKGFLEDERWGTYRYMEGSDVYEDKDEALATINSALMER